MMRSCLLATWLYASVSLATATDAHVVSHRSEQHPSNYTTSRAPLVQRADDNAADFNWITRWAAIGDSYTSGIGAGSALGSLWQFDKTGRDNWWCSRYDGSYAQILNKAFGPAVSKFQFLACTGDASDKIYKQVTDKLEKDLNLVMMTAGGNDLCLASVIKKCVFLSFDGESACNEVLDKAVENIDIVLKPNLKSILLAVNDKMAKDSIVVFNGYAQFFDLSNEDCADKQVWAQNSIFFFSLGKKGLTMTIQRRKKYNDLVIAINNAIKEVIEDVKKNGNVKYKIGFANWDRWSYEGVRGQMCDPKSDGRYPDPNGQPDLQFFKPDTSGGASGSSAKREEIEGGLEVMTQPKAYVPTKREMEIVEHFRAHERKDMYTSRLWRSVNPSAEALHQLNPRDAPPTPSCPGDGGSGFLSLGTPDSWGKYFHPNEKGHGTIASFALHKMTRLRAEVLGQDATCSAPVDKFQCWKKVDSNRSYANGDRMNIDYKDFCDNKVSAPQHEVNWEREATYNKGTPDEYTFRVKLGEKAADFDKEACRESFDKIINSCEGWGQDGVNWKAGGEWQRGEFGYRLNIARTNRPWPPPEKTHGDCRCEYKFFLSSYFFHGGGWLTWDNGEALKKSAGNCIGSTPTSWKFWYYDEPDKDGNEWAASFNTPVFTSYRCFRNGNAQKGAGGKDYTTNGCSGDKG